MARNGMRWFRFYSQAVEDPKVQRLPVEMRWHWVEILCLASRNRKRGHLPPIDDVAYSLRISVKKAESIIKTLLERRLLVQNGTGTIAHNWDRWQFESDNVTERVRQHRSNVSRNVAETFDETPPESESYYRGRNRTDQIPPVVPHGGHERPERRTAAQRKNDENVDALMRLRRAQGRELESRKKEPANAED